MANTSSTFQPDPDVHVTFEDQQKINKFARENAKLEELNDELNMKQKELQNLEDAGDELLMIEDDQPIPYMLGEVFVIMGQESATEMIEKNKERIKEETVSLQQQCDVVRQGMSELKVQLYAKFGNNINLEPDES